MNGYRSKSTRKFSTPAPHGSSRSMRSHRRVASDRGGVPEALTQASRGIRLQKVMANAGVASRRDCEAMILAGRVMVNGQPVISLPAWVDAARDSIQIDGRPVARTHTAAKPKQRNIYVILHKPRKVISTTHDPEQRRCVTDLVDLPGDLAMRLFPVGRLDADSSGLILLTNDGDLTNRLTHPRYGVSKTYHVSVVGQLNHDDLQTLREGLYLTNRRSGGANSSGPAEAKKARVAQVKLIGYSRNRSQSTRTNLVLTLREGQNREIRRLMARLGFKVRRLQRIGIGPLTLKGLAVGQWRLLTAREVKQLDRASGAGSVASGFRRD